MTTDDDIATHNPTTAAAIGSRPVAAKASPGDRHRQQDLGGCGEQDPAMVATESGQVHLDADFEQEQDHADIGKKLELLPIGDVPRRERREPEPDGEIADDRRQVKSTGHPARRDRREQDEPDLQDRGRLGVHRPDGIGSVVLVGDDVTVTVFSE